MCDGLNKQGFFLYASAKLHQKDPDAKLVSLQEKKNKTRNVYRFAWG